MEIFVERYIFRIVSGESTEISKETDFKKFTPKCSVYEFAVDERKFPKTKMTDINKYLIKKHDILV